MVATPPRFIGIIECKVSKDLKQHNGVIDRDRENYGAQELQFTLRKDVSRGPGKWPSSGSQISLRHGSGRLRQALDMTEVHLAKILRVNQAAVSEIERRADMDVRTLHDFVKAMGRELKITAKFPEGTVEITQFEVVKKAAAGKD
jgi:hypothetical protein